MSDENEILDSDFSNEQVKIPIYSKRAVRGFSILMSTFFGGFMLRQNLIDTGNARQGNIALAISFLFSVGIVIIVSVFPYKNPLNTILLNLIAAGIMEKYFFNNYIPDESMHEKKKLTKPLLIAIVMGLIFLGLQLLIYKNFDAINNEMQ